MKGEFMMEDYLVSIVLTDLSSGVVSYISAESESEAHKIAFEQSGLIKRSGEIGSYTQVLPRGKNWPRKWRGPKMYPSNGWQKK
jgi:hypothetical protein